MATMAIGNANPDKKYQIWPNQAKHLGFSKLLEYFVLKFPANKGTL